MSDRPAPVDRPTEPFVTYGYVPERQVAIKYPDGRAEKLSKNWTESRRLQQSPLGWTGKEPMSDETTVPRTSIQNDADEQPAILITRQVTDTYPSGSVVTYEYDTGRKISVTYPYGRFVLFKKPSDQIEPDRNLEQEVKESDEE